MSNIAYDQEASDFTKSIAAHITQARTLNLNVYSAREPTETQAYIATLDKLPSYGDLHALCTHFHALMLDDPVMTWLSHSFEDQADALSRACEDADVPQAPRDDSWPARQDAAVEAHESPVVQAFDRMLGVMGRSL